MPSVSFNFKVHIPYRLKKFTSGSVGIYDTCFDEQACKAAVDTLADECYLPANELILSLITANKEKF